MLSDVTYYRPQLSWDKVMFLHVSVILFTGGGFVPLHAWIQTPPRPEADSQDKRQTPRDQRQTPRTRHPPDQRQTPLRPGTPQDQRQTPWDQAPPRMRHPPYQTPLLQDQAPPQSSACLEIQVTSGRYTSYWNAILCKRCVVVISNPLS